MTALMGQIYLISMVTHLVYKLKKIVGSNNFLA